MVSNLTPNHLQMDKDLYGDSAEYVQNLEDQVDEREAAIAAKLAASQRKNANLAGSSSQTIQQLIEETKLAESEDLPGTGMTEEQELFKSKKIVDREDKYHQGRLRRGRLLSPERKDFFNQDST